MTTFHSSWLHKIPLCMSWPFAAGDMWLVVAAQPFQTLCHVCLQVLPCLHQDCILWEVLPKDAPNQPCVSVQLSIQEELREKLAIALMILRLEELWAILRMSHNGTFTQNKVN
jgi:hypothetical protein